MESSFFSELPQTCSIELDRIKVGFCGLFFPGGEENAAVFFIHECDTGYCPFALGQALLETAFEVIDVQVAPAIRMGAKEEAAAIFKKIQIFEELHPCGLLFLVDLILIPRSGIGDIDLDVVLAPVHPLESQPTAVRQPEGPGDIVVGLLLDIHPYGFSPSGLDNPQLDKGIRISGFGVSFDLQLAVGSSLSEERKGGNRAVIETQIGQFLAVWRPPKSSVSGFPAEDLFHVDPGGPSVVDGVRPILCELIFQTLFDIQSVEVMISCECDESPIR